jgi:hypothetical protein
VRELIEGGAKFQDAGTGGFYGNVESQGGRFVEEKDYAVEFAFTRAASKREAKGMEQIATTQFEGLLQERYELFEAVGSEGCWIEEEKGELANQIARAEAGEYGVRFDGLQDLSSVVVEDEFEKFGESGGSGGMGPK